MTRKLINPAGLHPTPGFSHIAVDEVRSVAYIAGQAAIAEDFSIVGGDDLEAQPRTAMKHIGINLEAVSAGWSDIMRRTIYTLYPTEFETITNAIEEVQQSSEHPAQSIIGVTGLAVPGMLVEIEVTVAIPIG